MTPALLALAALLSAAANADARSDYMLHCMGCHLDDGRGAPPAVPTLRGELGQILRQPGGRDYLPRVPGASQATIDDARLAAVINYVLVTFNADTLPANFSPYTATEVAKLRPRLMVDPARERAALWPTASTPDSGR